MLNLKLKEIISNSLGVHPNGSPFYLVLDGGAGNGSLRLTVVAADGSLDLVVTDPTSVADCMDQLALAIRRMNNIVGSIDVPLA
jgi:hypothetical protein